MPIEFNAEEIFLLAEKMERNGAEFYRKAAALQKEDSQERELLLGLAYMEDEHLKTFREMREEMSRPEWKSDAFAGGDEAAAYVQAMADGYVFNTKENPAAALRGKETLRQILNTALRLEQESIIFYLGMKDMTPEKFGKDRVEAIIGEEKRHIVILSRELALIK